jgi:hypothetical protein
LRDCGDNGLKRKRQGYTLSGMEAMALENEHRCFSLRRRQKLGDDTRLWPWCCTTP